MDIQSSEQIQPDQLELLGLNKENSCGLPFYTLNFTDKEPSTQSVSQLKEILKNHKVAIEIGPGNQLDSLLFASQKTEADIVIGIDPNFDFEKITQIKTQLVSKIKPTIILLKGDGWGDSRIKDLFGVFSNKIEDRLAIYAQLISPDTQDTERMINATIAKTKGGCLIVLDSGTVEAIEKGIVPLDNTPSRVKEKLLRERGIENPTLIDWITTVVIKGSKMKRMTEQEYQKSVNEGRYPKTSFLRKGEMILWEKPLLQESL
ncbi:MAG: hypothetical protein V1858_02525 [Candidatus Gottesmanbacteria bacterium]